MQSIVHYFLDQNVRGLLLKPETRQYDIEKSLERRYQSSRRKRRLLAKLPNLGAWIISMLYSLRQKTHALPRTHAHLVLINAPRRRK